MPNPTLSRESKMIASCAADQFTRLEAMFDAIRAHLTVGLYEHSLADVGQCVASQYATHMRSLAQAEARHG